MTQITSTSINGIKIAEVQSKDAIIFDAQSALDLMVNIEYELGCNRIAINKEAFSESFFKLSTGVAGEVMQKFTNYQVRLAVYGDFSGYTSKPLHDFIYESNKGQRFAFVSNLEQALAKLSV